MRVIVKKPNQEAEICEVSGIAEINKLVGNLDENGNGSKYVGSDIRQFIGKNVDIYVKDDALLHPELGANLRTPSNNAIHYGTIVFAGLDENNGKVEFGACSLTDEQIEYCFSYIAKQKV